MTLEKSLKTARQKLLELQARREHSQHELKQKLEQREYPSELIDQALQWLVEKKWQSDQRFTEAYVQRRLHQGYGPRRLEAELRARGISDTLIKQHVWALEATEPDTWQSEMIKAWRKKFGNSVAASCADTKQMRFLEQRGFTYSQIREGIRLLQQQLLTHEKLK